MIPSLFRSTFVFTLDYLRHSIILSALCFSHRSESRRLSAASGSLSSASLSSSASDSST